MKKILHHLEHLATSRNLLLSGGMLLVMALVIMPTAKRDIMHLSKGIPPLDYAFFYTAEKGLSHLSAYGEEGRRLYLFTLLTADVVFPIVFTIFFLLLLAWLKKRLPFPVASRLFFLPLILLGFDFLENTGIATLLLQWPNSSSLLATFCGFFTCGKWLSLAAVIGLLGWLFVRWGWTVFGAVISAAKVE